MSALEILNPDVVGVVGKALVGDGGGGISTTACSFVCKSLALSADRVRSIILDCGGELLVGATARGASAGRVGLMGGVDVVKVRVNRGGLPGGVMAAPRDDGRLAIGLAVGVGDFDRLAAPLPASLARDTTVKAKRPFDPSLMSSMSCPVRIPSTVKLTAVQA